MRSKSIQASNRDIASIPRIRHSEAPGSSSRRACNVSAVTVGPARASSRPSASSPGTSASDGFEQAHAYFRRGLGWVAQPRIGGGHQAHRVETQGGAQFQGRAAGARSAPDRMFRPGLRSLRRVRNGPVASRQPAARQVCARELGVRRRDVGLRIRPPRPAGGTAVSAKHRRPDARSGPRPGRGTPGAAEYAFDDAGVDQPRTCPLPSTMNFRVVSSSSPTGPRACSLLVLIRSPRRVRTRSRRRSRSER